MNNSSLEKPFLAELLGHCKGLLSHALNQHKKKKRFKKEPKKTTYRDLPDLLHAFIKEKPTPPPSKSTIETTSPKTPKSIEWVRQFTEDKLAVSKPKTKESATELAELDEALHSLQPPYKEQSKTTKKVMKKAIKSVAIPLASQQKKYAMRLYQNHANRFRSPQGWAHIAFLSILHVYLSSKKQATHDWHALIDEIAQLEKKVQTIAYDAKAIISVIKSGDLHPQFIYLLDKNGLAFNPKTRIFEAQAVR